VATFTQRSAGVWEFRSDPIVNCLGLLLLGSGMMIDGLGLIYWKEPFQLTVSPVALLGLGIFSTLMGILLILYQSRLVVDQNRKLIISKPAFGWTRTFKCADIKAVSIESAAFFEEQCVLRMNSRKKVRLNQMAHEFNREVYAVIADQLNHEQVSEPTEALES